MVSMKVLSQARMLRILLLLIIFAILLQVSTYFQLKKSSPWITLYVSRISSHLFKRDITLFDEIITESFSSHNLKIHDELTFTAFFPFEMSQSDLIMHVTDLESFFDKTPNSQLIDIGVTSGVFSIAAAVKGRAVVSVPADPSSARRLRKAAQVNKVTDRIAIVKNPMHGVERWLQNDLSVIEFDDLLTVARFREAVIRIDLDKYEPSSFRHLENLIKNMNASAIVTKWKKSVKWNDSIAPLLIKLTFHPFSSLVGHSNLASDSSLWPDYVIWMKPEYRIQVVNVYPITGRGDAKFPSGILSKYKNKPIKIFTYNKSDLISGHILSGHSWEYNIIAPLQKYMERDPGLQFLDIGSNIGVYTLSVAIMGRKAIAVDANHANLLRLAQSVRANGLSDRVILVNNALDERRKTLYVRLVSDNIGGSRVSNQKTDIRANAITADDLLEIIDFKRAVMKIDIEEHEWLMLKASSKLFEKVDIPLVIFEWSRKHQNLKKGAKMINEFFVKRGYVPFSTIDSTQPLPADYNTWPWDIVWKRATTANPLNIVTTQQVKDSRVVTYIATRVDDLFESYYLFTGGGHVIIHGYDSKDEITRSIIETNEWKPDLMYSIANLLEQDKTQGLLDIGTNIGVYALMAAKLCHKVVAVDANIQNVMRLRKSLIVNNLQNKVDIVWNAVDSAYTTVYMKLVDRNIGGSFVASKADATKVTSVSTITLDDLLKVITFKKAIMKYDIEGKEYAGLHNASRLFSEIDIPYVFMEWGVIKRGYKKQGDSKVPDFIIDFFESRNYTASYGIPPTPLSVDYSDWPKTIVWIKRIDEQMELFASANQQN